MCIAFNLSLAASARAQSFAFLASLRSFTNASISALSSLLAPLVKKVFGSCSKIPKTEANSFNLPASSEALVPSNLFS